MRINSTNTSLLMRIIASRKLRGIQMKLFSEKRSLLFIHSRDRSPYFDGFQTEARRSYCAAEAKIEIEM